MFGRTCIRIGTRKSKLALWQAHHALGLMKARCPDLHYQVQGFSTEGDRRASVPLTQMAGRGVFTSSLNERLKAGELDVVVHSLKDLPAENDPHLLLTTPTRDDPRECLVAHSAANLQLLPAGALVGASSSRREAQLRSLRPDLKFAPIRGNVDTRVGKVFRKEYDATILAAAGLRRLGLVPLVSQWFPVRTLLPAPGQAALALQCRRDDPLLSGLLAQIDDPDVREAVTAERTFLAELGGGCSLPIAALAAWRAQGSSKSLHLQVVVLSRDGQRHIALSGKGGGGLELGCRLAHRALSQGAMELLEEVGPGAKPLAGKRIVVTRAAGQAKYLGRRLEQLGADTLQLPLTRVDPLEPEPQTLKFVRELDRFDWLIFTSTNAVEAWWELAPQTTEIAAAGTPRIATVGPKTSAAVGSHGAEPALTPARFTAHELAAKMGDLSGCRVLLPRGSASGDSLPRLLRDSGAEVETAVIYRTLLIPPDLKRYPVAKPDVVTFTSGSSVKSFVRAVGSGQLPRSTFSQVKFACIGPATAKVAGKLGLKVEIIPRSYTTEGLVQAVVEHYQEKVGV